MIIFIDNILNGNIADLLGSELYAQTVAEVVKWWAVLPMVGLVLAFALIPASLFGGRKQ